MSQTPHPDPATGPVRHVDGNALAGVLSDVFAIDASGIVVACGRCGAEGPMGATDVEDDGVAAIVRCRACTHTLLTAMRTDAGVSLLLAAASRLDLPR